MSRQEIIKLLSIISTAYPAVEWTDEQVELWVMMLSDVPFSLAQANLRHHIKTSRFPPAIADIAREELQSDHEQQKLQTTELLSLKGSWLEQATPPPQHIRERWGRK